MFQLILISTAICLEIFDGTQSSVRSYIHAVDANNTTTMEIEHANCVAQFRRSVPYTLLKYIAKASHDTSIMYAYGCKLHATVLNYVSDFLIEIWKTLQLAAFNPAQFERAIRLLTERLQEILRNLQLSANVAYQSLSQFINSLSVTFEKAKANIMFGISSAFSFIITHWWQIVFNGFQGLVAFVHDSVRNYAYTYYFQTLAIIEEIQFLITSKGKYVQIQ